MVITDKEEIIKIAKKTIEKPEYQPGYPKWDVKKKIREMGLNPVPGLQPGVTWCNEAANEIMLLLGYDTYPILDKKFKHIGYTTANEMYTNAKAEAEAGNLQAVSAKEAQELTNSGTVVLVLAPGDKHGHVAVVMPCSHEFNPEHGCFIAQAGGRNGFFYVNETFKAPNVDPDKILYILLPEKVYKKAL